MILGRPAELAAGDDANRTTLDELFRRAGVRRPDAPALIDPPDTAALIGRLPRMLTYAAADRIVSAIATRLRRYLAPDSIVGLQLPNTVESALTLLAVLRAGMIAMPLPLLWRRAQLAAALTQVSARAIIVCARVGGTDHCELAMQTAADVFTIRHVASFGADIPDGVMPLDELFLAGRSERAAPLERRGNAAAHVAVITWDVDTRGLVPVARNHGELLAGGLAVLLESGLGQDASILSTPPMASFGAISVSLIPWLISGGTLVLQHRFDAAMFKAQRVGERCAAVVLPGSVVARLADAGLIGAGHGLASVLAVWRAPERVAGSPIWRDRGIDLVDVQVFGEIALLAARRGPTGAPAAIGLGPVVAGRGTNAAVRVAEVRRNTAGTVALRGPMVPRSAFPIGGASAPNGGLQVATDGFVDTGYACRVDAATGILTVTRPPVGMVSVGGYRFNLRDLQAIIARAQSGSTLTALPDSLLGQRLTGNAADMAGMVAHLAQADANPLVIAAFRQHRTVDVAVERASAA
ncbi:MAG: acyl--CoA ligase [Proteobacteria bacterium]|nr:acyl--CoA ligase [Pseudomonadota bacterium]